MMFLNNMYTLIFRALAKIPRKAGLYNYYRLVNDGRPDAAFKLVFFCGSSGLDYLNASLLSVYFFWKFVPDIVIVSDGTPINDIKERLIKWPKDVRIISWQHCAEYYREKGNEDIYMYATKELWGRKFTSILYCAEHFPTLYSDTDVLWFSSPNEDSMGASPIFKMAQDVERCYSIEMLTELQDEGCLNTLPLNAGIIYAKGNFSVYEKWTSLCAYLNSSPDNRSEQTAFAMLNNHFNREKFWNSSEILIKIDDLHSLRYTLSYSPNLIARHYVSTKYITFWRDFVYMCISKRQSFEMF